MQRKCRLRIWEPKAQDLVGQGNQLGNQDIYNSLPLLGAFCFSSFFTTEKRVPEGLFNPGSMLFRGIILLGASFSEPSFWIVLAMIG